MSARFGASAARLSGHAALLLGWTPDTFWSATPEELATILTALRAPDAVLLPEVSFRQVLEQQLRVMDQTAFTLCREHDLPIVVFDMNAPEGLLRAARGEKIGTLIH